MLLAKVVDQVATECDLEECTVAQYRLAEKKFSEWLGKQSTKEDLTLENLNGFIASIQKQNRSGTTARNYRVSITRLWNYLTEFYGYPPYCVRRLRRPKIDDNPVVAWTSEQIKQLIKGSDDLIGRMRCGVYHADFIRAWILVGYDTGLRPSDLRRITWDQIDLASRRYHVVQHKTRNAHCGSIGDLAAVALEKIRDAFFDTGLVFPLSKGGVRRIELQLYNEAEKYGFKRLRGQGIGTLRKSHATGVYSIDGENAAAESLGHVGGPRTVRKSYIDHRAVKKGRLPPPF